MILYKDKAIVGRTSVLARLNAMLVLLYENSGRMKKERLLQSSQSCITKNNGEKFSQKTMKTSLREAQYFNFVKINDDAILTKEGFSRVEHIYSGHLHGPLRSRFEFAKSVYLEQRKHFSQLPEYYSDLPRTAKLLIQIAAELLEGKAGDPNSPGYQGRRFRYVTRKILDEFNIN